MGTSPHSPAPTFLLRWDQSTCDRAQMARFLTANPDKANAWVAAQNHDPSLRWSGGTSLTASQIPAYLNELTPIRLLADTRVTNNGYVNGAPTPHQSVLQAGTAVLVDQYGVPRARCACGNPLQPPVALNSPVFRGNRGSDHLAGALRLPATAPRQRRPGPTGNLRTGGRGRPPDLPRHRGRWLLPTREIARRLAAHQI